MKLYDGCYERRKWEVVIEVTDKKYLESGPFDVLAGLSVIGFLALDGGCGLWMWMEDVDDGCGRWREESGGCESWVFICG